MSGDTVLKNYLDSTITTLLPSIGTIDMYNIWVTPLGQIFLTACEQVGGTWPLLTYEINIFILNMNNIF